MPNKQQKKQKQRRSLIHPPQFTSTIRVDKVMRFQASIAFNSEVYDTDLGNLIAVATGTTALARLAAAVKVRKIEMWGPMSSSLQPVTVECEWESIGTSSIGDSATVSDTSMGSTQPAHLVAKPPKMSNASFWQQPQGNRQIVRLSGPVGTIVDLHYSYTIIENDAMGGNVFSITGPATVGQVYALALDNASAITLKPVSYITIQ